MRERQLQVLNLIKLGKTNKEIADELFIASATVKIHVQKIMEELGADNRAHAVYIAFKKGMLD